MAATFTPRLNILPEAQRQLWPALDETDSLGFVLYGGTAIALRVGHRPSVDFDFFYRPSPGQVGATSAFPLHIISNDFAGSARNVNRSRPTIGF